MLSLISYHLSKGLKKCAYSLDISQNRTYNYHTSLKNSFYKSATKLKDQVIKFRLNHGKFHQETYSNFLTLSNSNSAT